MISSQFAFIATASSNSQIHRECKFMSKIGDEELFEFYRDYLPFVSLFTLMQPTHLNLIYVRSLTYEECMCKNYGVAATYDIIRYWRINSHVHLSKTQTSSARHW